MRIAYLLHWELGPESGVLKKVAAQARHWIGRGHEAGIFLLTRGASPPPPPAETAGLPFFCRTYQGMPERFRSLARLVGEVEGWEPDLVYHRFDLFYPPLRRLAGRIPLVLEVNSDDLREYRFGPAYRHWYNRLTRARLLRAARGTVFVTRELARAPHMRRHSAASTVIGNGIALADFPLLPASDSPAPRLVFMGTPGQPWHGLDKIRWLAGREPEWRFELIGPERAEVGEDAPPNLVAHGLLRRSEYQEIMASADVALGTLALHRKGMDEACPLKVREYLAYGIPTVIGYEDTDFPEGATGILRLPNCPANVEAGLGQIREFVGDWRGRRVPRSAIDHLDIGVKEAERLAFFAEVADR